MMMTSIRLAATVGAFGFATATAPAADDKPFSDADFVAKAWTCGIHEVELGKLAATNASDAEVKKYAERMVADHSKANEELKKVAQSARIPLPEKLTAEQQTELDRFRNLKGGDFDRAYIAHMIKDHEQAEAMLVRGTKELKDPGLKECATKALPVIQDHLKQARAIGDRLKKQ